MFNGTVITVVHIPITFSYGSLGGQPMPPAFTGIASQSLSLAADLMAPDDLAALRPDLAANISLLGSELPAGTAMRFAINPAELAIMGDFTPFGLNPSTTRSYGEVAINSGVPWSYDPSQIGPNQFDVVGAWEHEITEVLGRVAGPDDGRTFTLEDLVRYTAPGVIATSPGAHDYLSTDDGATPLVYFNDPSDGGDAGDTAALDDPFAAAFTPGVNTPITTSGTAALEVIGLAAVPCFAAGTLILTMNGEGKAVEVPVEKLQLGDRVVSAITGDAQEITWTGCREVDCLADPEDRPVRIVKDAFGPDLPKRDLFLSPDHAVYANGVLIPVKRLINGTTIRQDPANRVTYCHIELPEHDVILAEGLPAETLLDDIFGSRKRAFGYRCGPGFVVGMNPGANNSADAANTWEMRGCAGLIVIGPELAAVRGRLSDLAAT